MNLEHGTLEEFLLKAVLPIITFLNSAMVGVSQQQPFPFLELPTELHVQILK